MLHRLKAWLAAAGTWNAGPSGRTIYQLRAEPVLPLVTAREVDVDTSYNGKYSDNAAIVCENAPIFTPFGRELLRL